MLGATGQQSGSRPTDGQGVHLCLYGRMSGDRRKLLNHSTCDQHGSDECVFESLEQALQEISDRSVPGCGRVAYQRVIEGAAEHRVTAFTCVLTAAQPYRAHLGLHPGAEMLQQSCIHFHRSGGRAVNKSAQGN